MSTVLTLSLPEPLLLMALLVLIARFRSAIITAFSVVPRSVYVGLALISAGVIVYTRDAVLLTFLWAVFLPIGGALGQKIQQLREDLLTAQQEGHDAVWDEIEATCSRLGVAAPPPRDHDVPRG